MPLPGFDSACRLRAYRIAGELAKLADRIDDREAALSVIEQTVEAMEDNGTHADIMAALSGLDLAKYYRKCRHEYEHDDLFDFLCVGNMESKMLVWRDFTYDAKEEFEGEVSAWQPMVRIPEQVRPGDAVLLARIEGKVSLIGYCPRGGVPLPVYSERVSRERVDAILGTYRTSLRLRELGEAA